jgi:hypothetical protein
MLRRLVSLVAVPFLLLVACSSSSIRAHEPARGPEAGTGQRAGTEVHNESNETAERLDAFQQAEQAGTLPSGQATISAPAAGWTGSKLMNPNTDDWEPAVAADPNAPYVYWITTRYGQPKLCQSKCPTPYIALTISTDGGRTFGPQVPLCVCKGSHAQYDPTIEVVPNTGDVYAAFLNADRKGGFSTVFTRSTDHGKTWTTPVHVYGNVGWTDKPEVTMSASGRDVYVSWNGPTGGDLWMGVSHDYGKTWTQQKVVDSKRYFYAYDAKVAPDGTVIFSESSELYSGSTTITGTVQHDAVISRDNGKTWHVVNVDTVPVGEPCIADGCSPDFYTGQTSVSINSNGHIVFAYEGPTHDLGPQIVYVKQSNDDGKTWGPRQALSVPGEDATGPRLAAIGNGDVRVWYMQTANADDPDAWNVWYRSSTDAGNTWSSPVKLDDAPAGSAGYVNAKGFDEIYGDYGEIAITSQGRTFATWGEGFSWTGPGGTWENLSR